MIIHPFTKTFLIATVIFALFAPPVRGSPLRKRIQSNAPGWDSHLTPYPAVSRGDVVFQYRSEAANGNVSIPDPYNYFETSDASDFVKTQLAFTKTYLDKLEDLDATRSAIKEAQSYEPFYAPQPYGPGNDVTYQYYFKETGAKYWRSYIAKQKDLDVASQNNFATLPGKLLLDDSLLGGKFTFEQQISPDGTKLLYSIADPDTYDNVKAYVRDISNPLTDKSRATQEGGYGHYPDVITDIQGGSEIWSGDSKSIFYTSTDGSIRYHVLGTDAKDDPVIAKGDKDISYGWWLVLSDDLKYIFASGSSSTETFEGRRVYVASLDQKISGPIKWVPISTDYTFYWDYATSIDGNLYFRTTKGAPNHQIVRLNLDFTKAVLTDDFSIFTQGAESVTVIPQRPNAKITYFVTYDNDKILIVYNKDDAAELIAFNLKAGAKLQQLALDTLSTSVSLQAFPTSPEVYVQITSLNTPSKFYHLSWDHVTNRFISQLAYQQKGGIIDPDKYVVQRQSAPSKAGDVEIPFYVLHRKDLKLDGSHPVIINFFGAFGYNLPTWYDPNHFAFVHSYDAVYILAAPRGGGEKGDDWHKAGQLNNKQNTIDDILAVTQYAIDQKWTNLGKVIFNIQSSATATGSAAVNQAPEGLFGAFIGTRGYFDLLRIDQSKYKEKRIAEYGSPSDPKAFDWLRKYSPLHNVDSRKAYPTFLLYPPDDDSGAEYWHTYKFISELQHDLPNNPNPLLLGNGTVDQNERDAIAFALAAHTIGFKLVK
ncbi:hypothetical protein L7F22_044101 [Adiantum nelumboides]|nr:hypothetical protein [Adiantum nelumboides]